MQCMMNCQPQNRKRRNRQLPVCRKENGESCSLFFMYILRENLINNILGTALWAAAKYGLHFWLHFFGGCIFGCTFFRKLQPEKDSVYAGFSYF